MGSGSCRRQGLCRCLSKNKNDVYEMARSELESELDVVANVRKVRLFDKAVRERLLTHAQAAKFSIQAAKSELKTLKEEPDPDYSKSDIFAREKNANSETSF